MQLRFCGMTGTYYGGSGYVSILQLYTAVEERAVKILSGGLCISVVVIAGCALVSLQGKRWEVLPQ